MPSGSILMSQDAISAGAMGCPNCGACAAAEVATTAIAAPSTRRSSIDIACFPFFVDAPACNGIVVVDAAQPAFGHELRAARLHHAGVVGRTALQDGRTSVPLPRHAEAHWRLRQDRLLQSCWRPGASAVGRDIHLPD